MSEPKLRKLRDGTRDEIQRLSNELRFLEDALARKQGAKARVDAVPTVTAASGRSTDLSRDALHAYLVEYGEPAKPKTLADFLATKGIVRSQQAVRNGLVRLMRDGRTVLLPDGSYAAVKPQTVGAKKEAGPVGAGTSLQTSELQP